MATTNDLTVIEGIDINNSYELKCIDRLNTKVNAIDITGLTAQVATNTTNISTLQGQMTTVNGDVSTLTTNFNNMRIIVNVKDYGATGNGTTDDSVSITTAVSNLPSNYGVLYFPRGTYLISSQITISNKFHLLIKSDGASIKAIGNVYTLYFDSCPYLNCCEGSLLIYTETTGIANNVGMTIDGGRGVKIQNITFQGDFSKGLWLYENEVYGDGTNHNGSYMPPIVSINAYKCRVGIFARTSAAGGAEYTSLNNCVCCFNGIGLVINEVGNFNIFGGHYNRNGIGIQIDGNKTTGNTDHGKMVGATINHNLRCGLFINKTRYNFHIGDCDIYATQGSGTLTEATYAGARGFHYGMYIQDVNGLTIQGCRFGWHTNIGIGVDGWAYCSIIGCFFLSQGNTYNHLYEFNDGNTTYNRNRNIIISNNIFNGTMVSPYTLDNLRYLRFMDNTDKSGFYVLRDNTGDSNDTGITLGSANTQIINSVGSYWLGHKEFIHISLNDISVSNSSTTPADQATNIYMPCQFFGSKFTIYIYGATISSTTAFWIRFKSTNNDTPFITSNDITYSTTHKALKVSGVIYKIDFATRDNSGLHGWFIDGHDIYFK